MTNVSSTNISFNYLSHSENFLNIVLNNICSCVLVLNSEMELQAFNDAMKTIFSNKKDEDLLYVRCGEAIGCAFQVEEIKDCGKTSKCKYCELREAALKSYLEKKPVYKEKIIREFYRTDTKKELKSLQFSTRPFYFENEYYIIVIVEDITQIINQQELIRQQNITLHELKH